MGNDAVEDLCLIYPHSGNITKWMGGNERGRNHAGLAGSRYRWGKLMRGARMTLFAFQYSCWSNATTETKCCLDAIKNGKPSWIPPSWIC